MLFRCSHRQLTRPITPVGHGTRDATYVVCLDCGLQLPYDWDNMRLGREVRPSRKSEGTAARMGEAG